MYFLTGVGSPHTPTVSSSIAKLRKILDNRGKDNLYGKAADGKLPVVVHADNKVCSSIHRLPVHEVGTYSLRQYDILQLIKIKNEYSKVQLVIFGGAEAPAVSFLTLVIPIHVLSTDWNLFFFSGRRRTICIRNTTHLQRSTQRPNSMGEERRPSRTTTDALPGPSPDGGERDVCSSLAVR